ncbi:hypothetical protein ACFX2I_009377 [Malus domestica]
MLQIKEDQNFKDPIENDLENEEPPKEDPDNDDRVEEHTHDNKDTVTKAPIQENAIENDVAMENPEQGHAIDHDPHGNEEDHEHEEKDSHCKRDIWISPRCSNADSN